jgi:hypothetical protein
VVIPSPQTVVVPREPTEEMIQAAMPTAFIGHPEAKEESKARWFLSHRLSLIEKYKLMIAAAPAASASAAEGVLRELVRLHDFSGFICSQDCPHTHGGEWVYTSDFIAATDLAWEAARAALKDDPHA